MTELKPGPFCGSAAKIKRNKTTMVSCAQCTASTFQTLDDERSAIAAWNRRADDVMINGLTAAETSATASVAGSAGDGIRAALEAPGAAGVAVRAPECREVCMVADAGGYPPCGDGKKPCRALGVKGMDGGQQ